MNTRRLIAPVLALALGFTAALGADTKPAAPASPHFAVTTRVHAVLPPPPASRGAEEGAELELVLRLQTMRTAAQTQRAADEATLTPAAFASVMGEGFTAERFPLTFGLLMDVAADSKLASSEAKAVFNRARPQYADTRVQPSILGETDAGYPSGHATRGLLWATILGELAPEKKAALVERGEEIGFDRVVAGVHYPSDIFAGRVLGLTLARGLLGDGEFRRRLEAARGEFGLTR